MATARLSPAASLLRNSRLFSIPPPLSRPAALASETATQPCPTHAAIETPAASWERGDWGLKRSLPLKSTKRTGTTTIRVQNGIDSREHITDFESAADHVMTLKKLQELDLPIRFLQTRDANEVASVFEPNVDNISPDTSSNRRWRYKGPWLAGQTGIEFDALLNSVKARKTEFQNFVRTRLEAEKSVSRRQAATDAGHDVAIDEILPVSDEEFEQHMRYLRANHAAFGPLIAEFLDLPPGPYSSSSKTRNPFAYGQSTLAARPYQDSGPPKTHPSAGISYHRSGAHLYNHPVYGPQLYRSPTVARVLRPYIRRRAADIGIAGFVATDVAKSNLSPGKQWEPVPGGEKWAVRPKTAAVDSNGRIRLTFERVNSSYLATPATESEGRVQRAPPAMNTMGNQMPILDEGTGTRRRARVVGSHKRDLEGYFRDKQDRDHV